MDRVQSYFKNYYWFSHWCEFGTSCSRMEDNRISIDLAIETASYYGIKETDAVRMAEEILTTVRDNWERIAKQCGLSRTDIEDKRPAFNACYEV